MRSIYKDNIIIRRRSYTRKYLKIQTRYMDLHA